MQTKLFNWRLVRSMQFSSPIWRNRCRPLGRKVSERNLVITVYFCCREEKGAVERVGQSVWVPQHWVQDPPHRFPRRQRNQKKTGKVHITWKSREQDMTILVSAMTSWSSTAWTGRWSTRLRRWLGRRSPTWWSWCPQKTKTKSPTGRQWSLEASLTMWVIHHHLISSSRIQYVKSILTILERSEPTNNVW